MESMTKQQAIEFTERWRLVNRAQAEEVRLTPPDVKALQIAAAFQAAMARGLTSGRQHFSRWQLLREKLNG